MSTASAPSSEEPNQAREDGATPFDFVEHVYGRKAPRSARSFLAIMVSALRLVHESSPSLSYVLAGLQLVGGVIAAGQVLLAKVVLGGIIHATNAKGSVGSVLPALVALVGTMALSTLSSGVTTQLQVMLTELVTRHTWRRILAVTTGVRLERFESPAFFDELQRVQANALIRPLTMAQGLLASVSGLFGVAGLSVALLIIKPVLLPLLLAAGVPLFILSRRSGRLSFKFVMEQTPEIRVRQYLAEILSARNEAKEIRAFDLGPALRERWEENYRRYLKALRRQVRKQLELSTVGAVVSVAVTTATLGILVWLVLHHHLSLAAAGAAVLAIRLLTTSIQQLFSGVSGLFESSLFIKDLEIFLNRDELELEPVDRPGDVAPLSDLRVEHVWFAYPGTTRYVLRDLSLSIRAGEIVAVVGENGSGKTTLAKILAHVFKATQGRLLWNGEDSSNLDPRALRENVAVIFQDFIRYQLTARENIGLGRPRALDDLGAIIEASRQTGADEHLSRLPSGYETLLGKVFWGGYDLSLGQWQRVALARAFFRRASFLVLDEPTASLDPKSEYELFEAVRALAAGRTVLLISHRFSTVRSADRILVLHDGELVEQGTHEELMARAGRYAEMFTVQAAAYR